MKDITNAEILKVINETLGNNETPKKTQQLNEAYVLQPKKYSIQTDVLSQKSITASIEDFDDTVKKTNEISAKLDSVDRNSANEKDSEYRELKVAESHNLSDSFLMAAHFDNIADPTSKVMMDSLAYMRLARDFGSFELWQRDFIASGLSARNGYVVTVYNGSLNRFMNLMVDESNVGTLLNCYPIVCLCVKPQVYNRDYLNDRRSYIFAMMKELNWNLVEARVKRADRLAKLLSAPLGEKS